MNPGAFRGRPAVTARPSGAAAARGSNPRQTRMTEFLTRSESETRARGRALARTLAPGAVVALSGDLGSGKTAFIRGICEQFDCGDQVSSPTFTIINVYDGSRRIAHCDLYRIDRARDLVETGFEEYLGGDVTVLIEWAERALPFLPVPRIEIAAAHTGEADTRSFRVQEVLADEPTILSDPLTTVHHGPRH